MTNSIKIKSRLIASLLCAVASTLTIAVDAQARNLYVSPAGDNSSGATWQTAWQSFLSIDWNQVAAGDQIIVDGGATSTTYSGAFTIPVSGIAIKQAGGAGRNGQIVIQASGIGAPPQQTGVNITGSNVQILATRRSGIKISGFAGECARIQTNGNILRNVELGPVYGFPPYGGGRVGALVFGGNNNHFLNCDFRDSSACAYERPVDGVQNVTVFRDCTFGTYGYGWWQQWGIGIFGARPGASPVDSTIHARSCVFGPMLNKGVDIAQGRWALVDSLFLGSNVANVSFEPDVGSTGRVNVTNCTLYAPNYSGFAQYPTYFYSISTSGNGILRVKDSIVYGGSVHVPATQVINAGGNFQYHVTGNTTALAAAIVDPQYDRESDLWRPVTGYTISPRVWTTQSYALSPTSPAIGKGSSITQVSSIVAPYGPVGAFPPLGGP